MKEQIKNLEYYLSLPYKIEIIKDNGNNSCVAMCPELEGCLSSGWTIQEAAENLEDAKKC